jgi:transposase
MILDQKIPTEPADIIALLNSLGMTFGRIGIEAGPLSQWMVNALTAIDLPVICVATRHMKALLAAQQISKTDRNACSHTAAAKLLGSGTSTVSRLASHPPLWAKGQAYPRLRTAGDADRYTLTSA